MRIARRIPMLVIALALAAYGVDCPATSTRDEAMQCCDHMSCSSHGHDNSQECCNSMQATHAPFVKQSSPQGAHFSAGFSGYWPAVASSQGSDCAPEMFVARRS